uniref:Uncharacterized protein n=1 Tax=Ditylenchus dipsaci TaxID=166011 RepID=A0A915CV92_9BILA
MLQKHPLNKDQAGRDINKQCLLWCIHEDTAEYTQLVSRNNKGWTRESGRIARCLAETVAGHSEVTKDEWHAVGLKY